MENKAEDVSQRACKQRENVSCCQTAAHLARCEVLLQLGSIIVRIVSPRYLNYRMKGDYPASSVKSGFCPAKVTESHGARSRHYLH